MGNRKPNMPETMNKKAYQYYTQEFKDKAVGLLNLGKPDTEVAQELEIWAGDICWLPPHGSHPFG